jgi:hypothetical protein
MVSKPFEIQPRFPFVEVGCKKNFFIIHINLLVLLYQLKHKCNTNSVLFEAQIQNITNSFLYMENVQLFPPNENILVEDLHQAINKSSNFKYNNFAFIKPSEVKQYLFKVTYKNIEKEPKPLTVGKLDISWRNSFGEIGHLQTHPLNQTQEIYNLNQKDIQLNVTNIPDECIVDEEFNFKCEIINAGYLFNYVF